MEAGKLLKLSCFLVGYVEARRVLPSGCFDALGDVFRRRLQSIEHERFLACLGRLEVARHGLGSTSRRDMRGAGTYDHGRRHVVGLPTGG